MSIFFQKLQGLGNDFILFDETSLSLEFDQIEKSIPTLCDRRFGIGADGILRFSVVQPNRSVRMIYYNADGSRAETCFNGLRCIALWACLGANFPRGSQFTIHSDAGEVTAYVSPDENIARVEVKAGRFFSELIAGNKDEFVQRGLTFPFGSLTGTAVSMGNPHFVSWADEGDLAGLNDQIISKGADVERSAHFPYGTNFELARKIDEENIIMAVWERGVGQTLACGSGATATVCAGVRAGLLSSGVTVKVQMAGGTVEVNVQQDGKTALVTGPATHVFAGEIEIENFKPEISRG